MKSCQRTTFDTHTGGIEGGSYQSNKGDRDSLKHCRAVVGYIG